VKLTPHDLEERARWLIVMRWIACLSVVLVIWILSITSKVLPDPHPLYAVAIAMVTYNLLFGIIYRRRKRFYDGRRSARFLIVLQISLDLISLTLLLYFSGLPLNPFILYYVFHIVIASILLPGWLPYFLASLATFLVGLMLLLQEYNLIPLYPLAFPWLVMQNGCGTATGYSLYIWGVLLAVASTLGITVYFTTSISRYVEKVHTQIRQQQKMLGIGQLVAGFAHQVSNPLDGLQNGLRQIGQGIRGNPSLEGTVPKMLAALERIEKVARRLQEFARPQGLELQECNVPGAVEATLQLFGKTLAERKVAVEKDLAQVPPAWGDPYSVEEIIFNLCTNALDAMPEGGKLWLRTFTVERPDVSSNGCVAVEVKDSGQGIPRDRLEKIFEPFFTTKSQSGGTGLGLSLCRMLLSEMGGQIEVESAPNKGSTFRILLAKAHGGGGSKGEESQRRITETQTHENPGRR
jgi:signal transduction histidine kinase